MDIFFIIICICSYFFMETFGCACEQIYFYYFLPFFAFMGACLLGCQPGSLILLFLHQSYLGNLSFSLCEKGQHKYVREFLLPHFPCPLLHLHNPCSSIMILLFGVLFLSLYHVIVCVLLCHKALHGCSIQYIPTYCFKATHFFSIHCLLFSKASYPIISFIMMT